MSENPHAKWLRTAAERLQKGERRDYKIAGACDEAADEIDRLMAEINALRRGEFICQRCGIRKDADVRGVSSW